MVKVIKEVNSRDNQLLPHPPDLKQNPGSLKQRPPWLLSPRRQAGRPSPDGLAQQVQGLLRACHVTVLDPSTILAF